jgi:hypothetical protein
MFLWASCDFLSAIRNTLELVRKTAEKSIPVTERPRGGVHLTVKEIVEGLPR